MTFRKISEKVVELTPEGDAITFFEGYCDSEYLDVENGGPGLPTTNVCEGSNVIDTVSGTWYYFTEKTKQWLPKLNIGDDT